jgi:hypothetical protein
MKRLTLKGKIVGYEQKYIGYPNGEPRIQTQWRKQVDGGFTTSVWNKAYTCDSFDLGIKIGEEWWFENDVFNLGDVHLKLCYDVLNGWRFEATYNKVMYFYDFKSFIAGEFGKWKRIGTVYDKEAV